MALFPLVAEIATGVLDQGGAWGLFLLMALESMIVPVPSEAVMPFAGFLVSQGRMGWIEALLASSLGSLAGSLLSYEIGRRWGEPFVRVYGKWFLLSPRDLEEARAFLVRFGVLAILLSRFVPGLRHVVSLPAGAARMNLTLFSLSTLVGATGWNSILLILGYFLQENWKTLEEHLLWVDLVFGALLLAALLYVIARRFGKARTHDA